MLIRSKTFLAYLAIIVLIFVGNVNAQFNSGSTGTDGTLDYSNLPSPSSVVFDPSKFNHSPGQNTYNFTTINIPSGITVILSSQTLNGPVFWLAQGDAVISGNIQLKGQDGPAATANTSLRVPAVPGPGGYPGGIGANSGQNPQPGFGPGGGAAGINCCGSGDGLQYGHGGTFTGNSVLAPPIGGSGGGGAFCNDGSGFFGAGGGAGGGALVIASTTSIVVNGIIDARGGAIAPRSCNDQAGAGAGGSVELVSNLVKGSGQVLASGGGGSCCTSGTTGGNGSIRFESFQPPVTINTDIPASQAAPGALFQPNLPVSIQVVSVAGIQVANPALGRFQNPDVVINTGAPVAVTIQTTGIPPGTVLNLNVYSEDGSAQTVQTTPLQGTLQSATATANVTFPPDLSMGIVKATWTTQ